MLVLVGSALAAPVFVASDPVDAEVAQAAWAAAEDCTQRTPESAAEVRITRDLFAEDGPDGVADTSADGLAAIHLKPDADNAVLAHEVSHAWIHGADAWMVEGRTELLALCVAERIPETVRFRHWGGQPPLPADIRTWTSAVDSFASLEPGEVEAFYVNSQRLFEAVGLVVPPERLWSGLEDPAALYAVLDESLEGRRILAALDGVRRQREALGDPDRDGLTTLYERIQGTDPYRWDTDGDGWWDGSGGHPEHAVVVPRDGSPVCSPVMPRGAERMDLRGGGNLHGHDVGGEIWADSTPPRAVRMGAAHADSPGGMWIAVVGDDLVDNPSCHVHERYTFRDLTAQLPLLTSELDVHLAGLVALLDADFGPAPRRAGVELRDRYNHVTRFDDLGGPRSVEIPVSLARSAAELGQLDFLAAHAVAAFRFGFEPELRDMAAAAAFAWIATRTPVVGEPYVAAEREVVRDYVRRARRCETGWVGLAERRC